MANNDTASQKNADDLVREAYLLPVAERAADAAQWAQGIEAGRARRMDDPMTDVRALQRVSIGLLEAALARGIKFPEQEWTDPAIDPIGAIRQAGGIAALLAPAFRAVDLRS